MILEVRFHAESAIAEVTRELAQFFYLACIILIMAFKLHEFVVNPDEEPGGYPLPDKIAPFPVSSQLQCQRKAHGSWRNPQIC